MFSGAAPWLVEHVAGLALAPNARAADALVIAPKLQPNARWHTRCRALAEGTDGADDDDELIVCGARATLRTVKGDATVSWALRSVRIDAPLQFELNATVPPDTAARVLLPCANGTVHRTIQGGTWRFSRC